MTEAEWLACADPRKMLEHLRVQASDRKLRLFACACCRRAWHLLADERSREAVLTGERIADGVAWGNELTAARREAAAAVRQVWRGAPAGTAEKRARLAQAASATVRRGGGWEAASAAAAWAGTSARCTGEVQCHLLREVLGNPFRPRPPLAPAVLPWQGGLAVRMAVTIYDHPHLPEGTLDGASLAVLADALDEAGCTDPDIPAHCRQPGPHVRGCWAIDLLLGKG
jgi:hypothetical protein